MNFNSLVIKQNQKQADKPKYAYENEFHNSLVRLRFLCFLTDIKIAWINPCILVRQLKSLKMVLSSVESTVLISWSRTFNSCIGINKSCKYLSRSNAQQHREWTTLTKSSDKGETVR